MSELATHFLTMAPYAQIGSAIIVVWVYVLIGALTYRLMASREPCNGVLEDAIYITCGSTWAMAGDYGTNRCGACRSRYSWRWMSAIWPVVMCCYAVLWIGGTVILPFHLTIRAITKEPDQ